MQYNLKTQSGYKNTGDKRKTMPYYPEKKPVSSGDEQKQTRMTEKRKQLIRLSFAALSCFLILYGSVSLVRYFSDLNASRNTARELQQVYRQDEQVPAATTEPLEATALPSPVSTTASGKAMPAETSQPDAASDLLKPVVYPENPKLRISERFLKLRRKSLYIVGWLIFDQVDEAVAQKDNTFFLKHDATGKRNGNGAIFLDSDISLTTRPYTVILYGHNMKSGNMFGRLKKYKESAYFNSHRIITFDTLYEEGQYAVFSIMEMDTTPGTARWYDLWSLVTDRIPDREEAIRNLERRSVVRDVLDVRADDQILLLVTCLDDDRDRLVVAARRLRTGETQDRLTLRASSSH